MVQTLNTKGMDVLGVQETLPRGNGMLECNVGGECGMWEGMGGELVWSVMEGNMGRGKEGCLLLMSEYA